jgi:mannosyltransferase OCH1-like enzyme
MIPNIIWQTYKTPYPPIIANDCIKSWIVKNPDFKWYYFDDDKCDRFIRDHFNDEFYEMYTALPLGVMRSDIWRMAVIYIYGGIYADLDTECIIPTEEWLDQQYDFIIAVETPWGSLGNYAFAAAPKHPALLSALKLALELYKSLKFMDINEVTPVQNFGAHAFSHGILNHLEIHTDNMYTREDIDHNRYSENTNVKNEKIKFLKYHDHIFALNYHTNTVVRHHTASIFWKDGYESWRDQEQEYTRSNHS